MPNDHAPDGPCRSREAFATFIGGVGVALTYVVSIAYVLVDTYDKWGKARAGALAGQVGARLGSLRSTPLCPSDGGAADGKSAGRVLNVLMRGPDMVAIPTAAFQISNLNLPQAASPELQSYAGRVALATAADTLIWQLLASITIPGTWLWGWGGPWGEGLCTCGLG